MGLDVLIMESKLFAIHYDYVSFFYYLWGQKKCKPSQNKSFGRKEELASANI